MPKYECKGMSTEQFNPQDREKFWELYNGTLIEKEPLTVWLDDKEVKLHLYIEDVDMSEYDDTEEIRSRMDDYAIVRYWCEKEKRSKIKDRLKKMTKKYFKSLEIQRLLFFRKKHTGYNERR